MLSNAQNTLITGGTLNTISSNGNFSADDNIFLAFERLEKATAHAGFHNSIDRFDPPKCHPRTRTAILARIKAWIMRQDDAEFNMMWLTGGAGAGKSAIAQTIAEQCEEEGRLAGSFFFGRSDPSRNDGRKLIATIAYQICLNIPGARELVEAAVQHDPLILTRSLVSQMKNLIIDPLRQLQVSKTLDLYVVIIDGLDECQDRHIQCNILTTLSDAISQASLPLLFLVVSRPESHITTTMTSRKLASLHTRRILDETLSPGQDIELFLRDSFDEIKETHALKSHLPTNWPSDSDIYFLVRKASGHFVYASVVVKYVKSPRRRPTDCLEIVLGLRPSSHDAPFAELDALYQHILADVDDIEMVMHILSFLLFGTVGICLHSDVLIEDFLGLSPGDVCLHLNSLTSIVTFSRNEPDFESVPRITHASLEDFLCDKTRSNQFFIDPPMRYNALARRCFHHLRNTAETPMGPHDIGYYPRGVIMWYSQYSVQPLSALSSLTPELCLDISEFSIFSLDVISKQYIGLGRFQYRDMWSFISSIEDLPMLEDRSTIMTRHLQDMRTVVIRQIEEYYASPGLTTLISIFSNIWRRISDEDSYKSLCTMISPDEPTRNGLCYLEPIAFQGMRYHRMNEYVSFLQGCVQEREEQEIHPLDHGKYTIAALHLTQFLSSHLREYDARFDPGYSCHDLEIRRKYPWKWKRKKFGIHGTLTGRRLYYWRMLTFVNNPRDTDKTLSKTFFNTDVFRLARKRNATTRDNFEACEMAIYVLPNLLNRSDCNAELLQLADTIIFPFRLIKCSEEEAVRVAVQKYLYQSYRSTGGKSTP